MSVSTIPTPTSATVQIGEIFLSSWHRSAKCENIVQAAKKLGSPSPWPASGCIAARDR